MLAELARPGLLARVVVGCRLVTPLPAPTAGLASRCLSSGGVAATPDSSAPVRKSVASILAPSASLSGPKYSAQHIIKAQLRALGINNILSKCYSRISVEARKKESIRKSFARRQAKREAAAAK